MEFVDESKIVGFYPKNKALTEFIAEAQLNPNRWCVWRKVEESRNSYVRFSTSRNQLRKRKSELEWEIARETENDVAIIKLVGRFTPSEF
jgi:hypothetical protein